MSPGGVPSGVGGRWAQGGKNCFPVVREACCLVTKSLFFCCVIRAGRRGEEEEGGGVVAVNDGPFKENQEELVEVRERRRRLQVPVPCPTFFM